MSIFRRRAVLFGALLFGVGVLIGVGLAVLLRQPQGWPEQQRQLTELVRQQAPDAALLNITADGTWTPAGVQGLSVRAEYLRPSGERSIATFEAPLDLAAVRVQQTPPQGPGPVLPIFLQVGAEVQNRIQLGRRTPSASPTVPSPASSWRTAMVAALPMPAWSSSRRACRLRHTGW